MVMKSLFSCAKRSRAQQDAHTYQHQLESLKVSLVKMNGDDLLFDRPVNVMDRVEKIRRRAAAACDVHEKQIKLLHDGGELRDGSTVSQALSGVSGVVHVTVVLGFCKVPYSDWESYIKRDTHGVMEVDRIQFEFGHPLEYPKEEHSWIDHARKILGHSKPCPLPVPRRIPSKRITFPEPQDININMMPFIMGQKDSLPEAYQQYWPLIEQCKIPEQENIGYLSIQESLVREGDSQRRCGLHIESPGQVLTEGGKFTDHRIDWGCGIVRGDWSRVHGGIYMASNVPNSCKVWNVQISDPTAIAGNLGDIEHLRDLLGEGMMLEAGVMYWMTDATPHESLPLTCETYRQFFRVVAGGLSAWYPMHSTANPLGINPDPKVTQIIEGNKFE
eukprot:gnl/MRDRNA2_/MRDRNA2_76800_c0_seq1.p1 gnl/MRDRNA2_/MRDRNA2_76800_c0~~gnl/MRDRNA2_/MRDRNA2_76800_c0_seq1.p1  ORF type:complete len:388 (-),score=67.70 gnl/MRDRNA2_/MRDRNA2_76800_c0_seq1:10-1173(-)